MSRNELEARLKSLKNELEDLEDTFSFNLTHTSAHLSSGAVAEHEEEIQELRQEIARIEKLLSE